MIEADRLESWLRQVPALGPECRIVEIAMPKTGFSADTLLVDLADCHGGNRGLAVRVERPGRDTFLGAGIERQARMIEGLHRAGIRVPALFGRETDIAVIGAAFLVMERVEGRSLPQYPSYHVAGWLHDVAEGGRARIWTDALTMIAAINRLEWHAEFGFLHDARYGEPGLGAYLAWLRDWRDAACGAAAHPVIDAGLAWLDQHRPKEASVELLWGDSNPGNFLFAADGSVAAALDFEAAAIGPAEIDISWWFFLDEMLAAGQPLPAGLPDRARQVAIYEAALGRPVRDLDYYRVLCGVRMSLVMAQTVRHLIADSLLPPDSHAGLANPASAMLASMIDVAAPGTFEDYMQMVAVMNAR
jgi:aminoglycoside phosphotransferase (APT) family kinase protein